MNKFVSIEEAMGIIKDGDSVAVSGFVGIGHPEEISSSIEKKCEELKQAFKRSK